MPDDTHKLLVEVAFLVLMLLCLVVQLRQWPRLHPDASPDKARQVRRFSLAAWLLALGAVLGSRLLKPDLALGAPIIASFVLIIVVPVAWVWGRVLWLIVGNLIRATNPDCPP